MDAKTDTRNLQDQYKGLSNEQVFAELERGRNNLEVAIENVTHDFNAGTIVRSANNFNAAKVHIIGKKKYNRRGAMCTDKYLEILHWPSWESFIADQQARGRQVVAIENHTERAQPLSQASFAGDRGVTLLFGGESDGLSEEALMGADEVREIESFGSTRSVNVGVAAGIAMWEWARQCVL